MPEDTMPDDRTIETAKAAWQSQHVDAPLVSIDYLRNRAQEHAKKSRTRSVLEHLLGGAAVGLGVWLAAVVDSLLFRVGVIVMSAGMLYALHDSWRRRMVWSVTLEGSAAQGQHFYKQELARLRDLHRRLWKVYLPASIPGAVVLLVWAFLERSELDNGRRVIILAFAVATWIVVMVRHEAQEAKRYQRELDALEKNGSDEMKH
jgi:hypothetical protein